MKIFIVYDNKGEIRSVGASSEEVKEEEQFGLEVPEDRKVLELKSSDLAKIPGLDQDDDTLKSSDIEKQKRILRSIFESYQIDTNRLVLIRRSAEAS